MNCRTPWAANGYQMTNLRKPSRTGAGSRASRRACRQERASPATGQDDYRASSACAGAPPAVAVQRDDHRLFSGLATDLRSDRFQATSWRRVPQAGAGRVGAAVTLSDKRYSWRSVKTRSSCRPRQRRRDADQRHVERRRDLSCFTFFRSGTEPAGAGRRWSLEPGQPVSRRRLRALDPDTLATVSETIQSLQVAGRIVGVITHIPELATNFPSRSTSPNATDTPRCRSKEVCSFQGSESTIDRRLSQAASGSRSRY